MIIIYDLIFLFCDTINMHHGFIYTCLLWNDSLMSKKVLRSILSKVHPSFHKEMYFLVFLLAFGIKHVSSECPSLSGII